jgi:uncharacterized protein (DUF433 family)
MALFFRVHVLVAFVRFRGRLLPETKTTPRNYTNDSRKRTKSIYLIPNRCAGGASAVGLSCKSKRFCYHSRMDYSKIITIEPGKRGGKPTIRGTRMTVTDVLEYLASGMSEEEILADFPDLTTEDIKACLAFAADRERKLATLPQHETAV